jgi:alkanesulfonate monooxygenase SsuD/methylene tetrahydromethanopterin reductase-like flavin-dependent oxidoreductase (luciferase family)
LRRGGWRKAAGFLAVTALLAVVVGALGWWHLERERRLDMGQESFPVVRLKLGDSMAEVQSGSGYQFPPPAGEPRRPLAVSEPVILEYVSLDDAISLAASLIDLFDSSGWTRTDQGYPSLEERRAEFSDMQGDARRTVAIQMWRSLGDRLYITLARNWREDQSLPEFSGRREDFFVVTVFVENDSIANKYLKESESGG